MWRRSTPAASTILSICKYKPCKLHHFLHRFCTAASAGGTRIVSLFVYTRHTADCPKRSDRFSKRCRCPKWIRGVLNDLPFRQTAGTRSWEKADQERRLLENETEARTNSRCGRAESQTFWDRTYRWKAFRGRDCKAVVAAGVTGSAIRLLQQLTTTAGTANSRIRARFGHSRPKRAAMSPLLQGACWSAGDGRVIHPRGLLAIRECRIIKSFQVF